MAPFSVAALVTFKVPKPNVDKRIGVFNEAAADRAVAGQSLGNGIAQIQRAVAAGGNIQHRVGSDGDGAAGVQRNGRIGNAGNREHTRVDGGGSGISDSAIQGLPASTGFGDTGIAGERDRSCAK